MDQELHELMRQVTPERELTWTADRWMQAIRENAAEYIERGISIDGVNKLIAVGKQMIDEWMSDPAHDLELGIAEALAP